MLEAWQLVAEPFGSIEAEWRFKSAAWPVLTASSRIRSAKRPFVGMVVLYYPAPEEGIGRAIDLALAVIPSKPERLCGSGDGH
jgi:hypothetical protein